MYLVHDGGLEVSEGVDFKQLHDSRKTQELRRLREK